MSTRTRFEKEAKANSEWPIDEGLTLETSASISLHGGNLNPCQLVSMIPHFTDPKTLPRRREIDWNSPKS